MVPESAHFGDEVLVNESCLINLFRRFRFFRIWSDLREMPHWFTDAEQGIFTRDFLTNPIKHHLLSSVLDTCRWVRRGSVPAAGGSSWYKPEFWETGVVQVSRSANRRRFSSAY